MKRFLLVIGILLCLQSCAFAKNLYDFGNGLYVDLDSLSRVGDYGYAFMEYYPSDSYLKVLTLSEIDLSNSKAHYLKVNFLDKNDVCIVESVELPKFAREWHNFPENSPYGVILEMLKNLEP